MENVLNYGSIAVCGVLFLIGVFEFLRFLITSKDSNLKITKFSAIVYIIGVIWIVLSIPLSIISGIQFGLILGYALAPIIAMLAPYICGILIAYLFLGCAHLFCGALVSAGILKSIPEKLPKLFD